MDALTQRSSLRELRRELFVPAPGPGVGSLTSSEVERGATPGTVSE